MSFSINIIKEVATPKELFVEWSVLGASNEIAYFRMYKENNGIWETISPDLPNTYRSFLFSNLKSGKFNWRIRPIIGGNVISRTTNIPTEEIHTEPPPSTAGKLEKGLSVDLTWASNVEEQQKTKPFLIESGSKYVRMTMNWSDAEPKKEEFNSWWVEQYDNAIKISEECKQKIIFVVGSSPSWSSGSTNTESPPKNVSDYSNFIGKMVSRYKGKIAAWEIWNEQNTTRFWSTGPSAKRYTELLKAAYSAVKKFDPSARVLFGGTSLNDYKFISECYKEGAKGSFDVMAVHPYSCEAPSIIRKDSSGKISESSFLGYRSVREVMVANSDEKPIWFTEIGWSSATSGECTFGLIRQAEYLTEAYKLAAQDPYIEVMCWYNLRNDYWSKDANEQEPQYGLMSTKFVPKPSFNAFKSVA